MKPVYTLLDGERVFTHTLVHDERQHIAHIEDLIENKDDYFRVFHEAFVDICATMPHASHKERALQTPHYRILVDVVERYRRDVYVINDPTSR